jgi:glycine/D-amino acid oxidase-like deaminating enzyme
MDLKSGCPYWLLKNGLLTTYPALRQDISCEVAVIGGGVTGAFTAYYLTKAGVETVLLDKRGIGQGSTSANTALLFYELDIPLSHLIETLGEHKALRSYQLGLEAIDTIQRLVARLGDSCGFERKKSLYLASRKKDVPDFKREYEVRRRLGFRLDYLEGFEIERLFSIRRPAALLSHDAAQIDPYRLTQKLVQKASGQGLRTFDATEVIRCQHKHKELVLTTNRGHRIKTRKLVFAAGYESQQYLKEKIVTLKSTYAVASQPLDAFPVAAQLCLIWESARPYIYLRTTSDCRVMLGGEDESFVNPDKRDRLIPRKSRRLQDKSRLLFPAMDLEIAYSWAGTFGETEDGLAYIGETKHFPNAYFALSYGANGTTYALVAAEIIRDLYLGRPNKDAAIFSFDDR